MSAVKDLIVLSSCTNSKFAIQGILESPSKLGLRQVQTDYFVHPHHDPGCRTSSAAILRSQQHRYDRALVIFDREGCGAENLTRLELEQLVQNALDQCGWQDRSAVIAIDPELEAWVWSDSPEVPGALGWPGIPPLRTWLIEEGWLDEGEPKPSRPKEALECVLRTTRKRRTSALFLQLARRVSYRRCADPAFLRLAQVLQAWFPEPQSANA